MTDWPGRRVSTGPALAVRATSPASPYARDRIEAPSNRPAPRTPTLRSRTQDVLRSAPGALTAARERSVYDTTPQDLVRGAQEITGLPSLARGAGALAAIPALVRTGSLGTEHLAPGAMAVGETALGLLGPMSLPRGAGRVAAPVADTSRSISAGTLDGRTFYRGQGGDIQGGGSFRRNSHISANPETANSYATMNLSGAERAPTVFPLRGTGRIADRDGVMSVVDELVAGGMSREEALRQAIPELERRGFAGFQMARRGDPEFDDDIQIFNPSANLRSAFDAEPAERIPNMAREIGPNGMPVAQSQPTRNSFRGGSSDLREAAALSPRPPVGSISGMPAPEGRRIVYQGGPRPLQGDALDDAQLGTGQGASTFGRGHYVAENPVVGESYARQLGEDGRGFTHELDIPEGPYIDIFKPFSQQDPRAQEAIRRLAPQFNWDVMTSEMSDALTILGRNEQRVAEQLSAEGVRGLRYLDQRSRPGSGISHLGEPTSNYVVFRGADARRRFPDFGQHPPPPTTPTGTAPFGDPRAYPPQAWEEFGSLQGGAPEARLRAQEQGYEGPFYHGTMRDVTGAFRPSLSGANGPGVYMGVTPETAASYAGIPSPDGIPLTYNGRNVRMDYARTPYGESGGNIMPLYARGPMATSDDWRTALRDAQRELRAPDQTRREVQELAQRKLQGQGYTGLRDTENDYNVIFPDADGQVRNVRSAFAAFDPARRNDPDILAGLSIAAPIPIAGALTQQQNTTGRSNRRPSDSRRTRGAFDRTGR